MKRGPVFKPNLQAEPWLSLAVAIRAAGMRVTPFQLGAQAGLQGKRPLVPYSLPRSRAQFRDGVAFGLSKAGSAA